jgi:hypothetical protein
MTTLDPSRPVQGSTRPVQTPARAYDREPRETKPSPMTTEFWAMLVGVIAIVVVYNVSADRSLNLFRAATLACILAVGYFVSRGLAKSGTADITRDDRH